MLLISYLIGSCSNIEKNHTQLLNKNWKFKSENDSIWMDIKIPGSVHIGLLENNIIEDPYYRLNEHDVQWVDKKNWEFKTSFKVNSSILKNEFVELEFVGLDTYADIYLNEENILSTNNMFINWKVDCKDYLKIGNNELKIVFKSPINEGLEKRDKLPYLLPGAENDQSELGGLGDKKVCVFTRKAQYHFGWDWGPRLVSIGIWRDIKLNYWNKARIEDLYIEQINIDSNQANLIAHIKINSSLIQQIDFNFKVDGNNLEDRKLKLKKGLNKLSIPLNITNPELWWTNGLGNQKLYSIEAQLTINNTTISSSKLDIGLRTLELIREKDDSGRTFKFKLNGRAVFMKGANYIPQDIFLSRVDSSQYEHLIKSAAQANFNMLRVWGGGIYEKELFYDLCDKYGILVWQDFMFECAMYPGNPEFLENVSKEARKNIIRLRNHPSIALWCGDNEILSAWNRWGWKENVLENQGKEKVDIIWNAYDTLFHNILPSIVKELDPKTEYWSSSPSSGIGELENHKSGDMHYWGVWWAKEPFSEYKNNIGRFMSEYGFQSFPEMKTINKYTKPEDHDINSEVMKSHQRSSIGNVTILEYMNRDYKKPKDFPMFVYVNHLLQAEGIKTAIEAHRRSMPYCMGSLYWQLNDCWPVASWSGIDYYGNWKALHYFVRNSFKNILVSPDIDSLNQINIFGISDFSENINAKLNLNIINFHGDTLWKFSNEINLIGNQSKIYFSKKLENILKKEDKTSSVLVAKILDENHNILSQNYIYFDRVKNLNLPNPNPDLNFNKTAKGFEIVIVTDKLIKNAYLYVEDIEGHFSDNYFDVLPNEELRIVFYPEKEISIFEFESKIKFLTLTDSYR
ncbi:MAG: beta-mannosidase [Marinilabiliales bacterium]|nr:MAG: beta-mannosidase [Marinilabiliales bacterium]